MYKTGYYFCFTSEYPIQSTAPLMMHCSLRSNSMVKNKHYLHKYCKIQIHGGNSSIWSSPWCDVWENIHDHINLPISVNHLTQYCFSYAVLNFWCRPQSCVGMVGACHFECRTMLKILLPVVSVLPVTKRLLLIKTCKWSPLIVLNFWCLGFQSSVNIGASNFDW